MPADAPRLASRKRRLPNMRNVNDNIFQAVLGIVRMRTNAARRRRPQTALVRPARSPGRNAVWRPAWRRSPSTHGKSKKSPLGCGVFRFLASLPRPAAAKQSRSTVAGRMIFLFVPILTKRADRVGAPLPASWSFFPGRGGRPVWPGRPFRLRREERSEAIQFRWICSTIPSRKGGQGFL